MAERDLKGSVDLVGLGNLLQLISLHKCEGTLDVARGTERQSIHIGPEGIRLISSKIGRAHV